MSVVEVTELVLEVVPFETTTWLCVSLEIVSNPRFEQQPLLPRAGLSIDRITR